mgnify:CR=1 FL=1
MILYYIQYHENWAEDIQFLKSRKIFFPTKEKAEIFWKDEIKRAKAHNKFPKPHQIMDIAKIDVGGYRCNINYADITKDNIKYNAPKNSHYLFGDDYAWNNYSLYIYAPKKIDLGKNKKEIAWKLTNLSSAEFEA